MHYRLRTGLAALSTTLIILAIYNTFITGHRNESDIRREERFFRQPNDLMKNEQYAAVNNQQKPDGDVRNAAGDVVDDDGNVDTVDKKKRQEEKDERDNLGDDKLESSSSQGSKVDTLQEDSPEKKDADSTTSKNLITNTHLKETDDTMTIDKSEDKFRFTTARESESTTATNDLQTTIYSTNDRKIPHKDEDDKNSSNIGKTILNPENYGSGRIEKKFGKNFQKSVNNINQPNSVDQQFDLLLQTNRSSTSVFSESTKETRRSSNTAEINQSIQDESIVTTMWKNTDADERLGGNIKSPDKLNETKSVELNNITDKSLQTNTEISDTMRAREEKNEKRRISINEEKQKRKTIAVISDKDVISDNNVIIDNKYGSMQRSSGKLQTDDKPIDGINELKKHIQEKDPKKSNISKHLNMNKEIEEIDGDREHIVITTEETRNEAKKQSENGLIADRRQRNTVERLDNEKGDNNGGTLLANSKQRSINNEDIVKEVEDENDNL